MQEISGNIQTEVTEELTEEELLKNHKSVSASPSCMNMCVHTHRGVIPLLSWCGVETLDVSSLPENKPSVALGCEMQQPWKLKLPVRSSDCYSPDRSVLPTLGCTSIVVK